MIAAATVPAFYTLAAEIIPVLFIALLLQGDLFRQVDAPFLA